MRNVVTGLLIVFFVSVYILSVTSVKLVPKQNSETELCGVSVGNAYEVNKINNIQKHSLKLLLLQGHAESIINYIDTDFSFDLFAISENLLPQSNYISSKFISRENQKPKQLFIDPVFLPS